MVQIRETGDPNIFIDGLKVGPKLENGFLKLGKVIS